MQFNSLSYLVFFPIVMITFFVIPKKLRCPWLLLASYFFYGCWNVKYAALLFLATVSSYAAGILLEKAKGAKGRRKAILAGCLLVNFGMLGFFKYFSFLLETIHKVIAMLGGQVRLSAPDVLLPMGISFFTFQAVGYVMDIWREKIKAERNIVRYALFLSFFPQLVAGPIERAEEFLPQIREAENLNVWDEKRIRHGTAIMLYGYFMKMVIADRAAIFVDAVFQPDAFVNFQGTISWVAAIFFSIQIYCDFAGYTLIAIGSAKALGFHLTDNFHTPYLARSIRDFWSRWHISLTGWFRDYLYFPLGGNRKGKLRKYLNVMIVFLVSGLWHGAGWHFVLWGGIHGGLRVLEELTDKPRKAIRSFMGGAETFAIKLWQTVCTFLLVTIAWVAFRAASIGQAIGYVKGMFSKFDPWVLVDGSLYRLGLDEKEFHLLLIAILILIVVDVLTYRKKRLAELFTEQPLWFRWIATLVFIGIIVVFGVYGENYDATAFLYFQF